MLALIKGVIGDVFGISLEIFLVYFRISVLNDARNMDGLRIASISLRNFSFSFKGRNASKQCGWVECCMTASL